MAPGIGNVALPIPIYVPNAKQTAFLPQREAQQSPLHHHSLITTDSNALQFHAAASLQLKSGRFQDTFTQSFPSNEGEDLLITSPYNAPPHLLNLSTLDTANQLLAKALTIFQPIRDDYATAPYLDSFNWSAVIQFLRHLAEEEGYRWTRKSFYVVAFRSRLFDDVDGDRLSDLDAHSHREASQSGGLLKYWFGSKDGKNRNLATCLWRSREDARNGGTGPWHRQARMEAKEMYEKIEFSTMELLIENEVSGWEVRDWRA